MRSTAIVILLALLIFESASAASPASLSSKERNDLQRVVLALRDAIVREDVPAIMKRVSQSGLSCTDDHIAYKKVEADLQNKDGYLHRSLFDSANFAKECGAGYGPAFPAISDKEFFSSEQEQSMEVLPSSAIEAQVVFKSRIPNHYQREWDFRKEHGEWKLKSGVVVASCSCG